VHSAVSSEYGDSAAGPREDDLPQPNSDYAVSKVACANLLRYYGKRKKFPCANLRLFSAYGPLEDSSRLIPTLIKCGCEGNFPPFVNGAISRDFVYIDDLVEAYVDTALNLREENFGDSFNIGSGAKTTIAEVAKVAADVFSLKGEPAYGSMEQRQWISWIGIPTNGRPNPLWAGRPEHPSGKDWRSRRDGIGNWRIARSTNNPRRSLDSTPSAASLPSWLATRMAKPFLSCTSD